MRVVREIHLHTYVPAYLDAVEKAWETKREQTYWEYVIIPRRNVVVVRFRDSPRIIEIFPKQVIEKIGGE